MKARLLVFISDFVLRASYFSSARRQAIIGLPPNPQVGNGSISARVAGAIRLGEFHVKIATAIAEQGGSVFHIVDSGWLG